MSWQYFRFTSIFPFLIQERWGDLMKTNCEVLSWREGELFSFELINKLVRELSPIYRLNFYQLLLFFCQKIQLQLLLSFLFIFFYIYSALYLLLPTRFYILFTCFHLLFNWQVTWVTCLTGVTWVRRQPSGTPWMRSTTTKSSTTLPSLPISRRSRPLTLSWQLTEFAICWALVSPLL